MKRKQNLFRPVTLETGATYMYKDFLPRDRKIAWVPVRFVSYSPCAGIVIVVNGSGSKLRVKREDLFCDGFNLTEAPQFFVETQAGKPSRSSGNQSGEGGI
jgi:hypothetical protein